MNFLEFLWDVKRTKEIAENWNRGEDFWSVTEDETYLFVNYPRPKGHGLVTAQS